MAPTLYPMASNQNVAFAVTVHAKSNGKETKTFLSLWTMLLKILFHLHYILVIAKQLHTEQMEPEVSGATAEEQELVWGRSLSVPSVQEIVRKDPNCVPERHIRDQIKRVEISKHSDLNIPVIDFSKLSGGDEAEINKLDLACEDWGFFQVSST